MPLTPEEARTYYVKQALKKAGRASQNATFEFAFDYATDGGVFTVQVNTATTAPIAFPPSADALKASLEALLTVGAGGVKVRGQLGGPYALEFIGANAGQVVTPVLVDGSDLVPSQDVAVTEWWQGETLDLETDAYDSWDNNADGALNYEHRGLLVQLDLIEMRENMVSEEVDTQVGQNNLLHLAQNQKSTQLQALRQRIEERIAYIVNASQSGKRITRGGAMVTKTPNAQPFGVLVRNPLTGRRE